MFEVGSHKRISGAWCAQNQKMQEYLGRNIASAVQHTRPSMRKMVTASYPGMGGDPSCMHGPRGICVQRPRPAVACCDVTQARMGVQGRFLDASGSTRQPKYNPFRGAAMCRLVASARRQMNSAFEPHILLRAPLTNFLVKSPHQMQFD